MNFQCSRRQSEIILHLHFAYTQMEPLFLKEEARNIMWQEFKAGGWKIIYTFWTQIHSSIKYVLASVKD